MRNSEWGGFITERTGAKGPRQTPSQAKEAQSGFQRRPGRDDTRGKEKSQFSGRGVHRGFSADAALNDKNFSGRRLAPPC